MIRPLGSRPRARRFLTYDLEWIPGSLDLRCVSCYDGRRVRTYVNRRLESLGRSGGACGADCPHCKELGRAARKLDPRREGARRCLSDFLNAELTARTSGAWFYAHAGGLADFQFLLEHLIDLGNPALRLKGAFAGSAMITATLTRDSGRSRMIDRGDRSVRRPVIHRWHFVDSYWLIRQPLAAIGEWIGEPKAECAFHAPIRELAEYNRQDCIVLWKAIDHFESVLLDLGGQLEKTIASSAMGLFRRAYLGGEIPTWPGINADARGAYIASRVEAFRPKCGNANYYDINSSFPDAMTRPAPGALLGTGRRLPDHGLYLADADVTAPECWLPPLGYRTPDGRLFFPAGSWRAWFTNTDLQLLEETGGRIDRVQRAHRFEPFTALRDYAQTIYELRARSAAPSHRQVYKILLNSLYGKFAERGEKRSLFVNPPNTRCPHRCGKHGAHLGCNGSGRGAPLHPSGGDPGSCWEFVTAGVWLHDDVREIPHAHVPIAAHITAVARRSLFERLSACGERSYYCDTDGFATDCELPTGPGLGELKLEHRISQGRFVAPKLAAYQPQGAEWIVKAKGFPRMSYAQFCDLLEGHEIERERMVRIRENLRRGQWRPVEERKLKGLRGAKPKRAPVGLNDTRPWRVGELCEN